MNEEKEYDFIVGFTLFGSKGTITRYYHFDDLKTAIMFASNKNLKNNCKIYVDYDFYKILKEKNKNLELL